MQTLALPEVQEWTLENLERLPDEFRYEVREGNLVILSAAMRPWHARTQFRLLRLLGDLAYQEQGVVLSDSEIRTCDVGVYHRPPLGEQAYRPASEFALVVEVVSRSSVREDREVKPRLYAEAGVPEFWRVEEAGDDAEVHRFRLDPQTGGYVERDVVALTKLEA